MAREHVMASMPASGRLLNPWHIVRHLWGFKDLIRHMTWREVTGAYKGSFGGLAWSIINPLLMLCVYTFVFSVIFRARWGGDADESKLVFALTLYLGLVTFMLLAETLNAAPNLIIRNANYVKKVVFPLEILPVIQLGAALINALLSLVPLLVGIILIKQTLYWTMLWLPLVWLPMILLTLGLAHIIASLGVFIRDLASLVSVVTTMLRFLCPIFYPLSAVPPRYQVFIQINPISIIVEDTRRVFLWGMAPDWPWFALALGVSLMVWATGFFWFCKTKKAFADVI